MISEKLHTAQHFKQIEMACMLLMFYYSCNYTYQSLNYSVHEEKWDIIIQIFRYQTFRNVQGEHPLGNSPCDEHNRGSSHW